MRVLITGSCGLIGSEAAIYYLQKGHEVCGIDNHLRSYFFGENSNTASLKALLSYSFSKYTHHSVDIRDQKAITTLFQSFKPEYIIHTAAQPSHDWAAREPLTDFEINALSTLYLLEATRQYAPEAVFIFLSTNKVYGDSPNHLALTEEASRYEFKAPLKEKGICEMLSIDQSLHSLFGASKLSADILCQEYGRYFGIRTGIFRGGCLTGSRHKAAALHGFLNYLVDSALQKRPYTVMGYKGKQVRDQIHASDVISAFEHFQKNPRCGEVYNLGGGYGNSASIKEIVSLLKIEFGLSLNTNYDPQARKGDHICYYSDLTKFKTHYPEFKIQMGLKEIIDEIIKGLKSQRPSHSESEREITSPWSRQI